MARFDVTALVVLFSAYGVVYLIVQPGERGAVTVAFTVVALTAALAAIVTWITRMIALDGQHSPRAPLPRHAGHARSRLPRGGPEAGPTPDVPPAGPADPAAVSQAGAPAAGSLHGQPGILNPRLYETGEMPGISQAAADEAWWLL